MKKVVVVTVILCGLVVALLVFFPKEEETTQFYPDGSFAKVRTIDGKFVAEDRFDSKGRLVEQQYWDSRRVFHVVRIDPDTDESTHEVHEQLRE